MGDPRTWTPLADVAKREETPREATSFNCRSEAGTDRQQTLQGSESSREDEPAFRKGRGTAVGEEPLGSPETGKPAGTGNPMSLLADRIQDSEGLATP
jgi:hypothetical protein